VESMLARGRKAGRVRGVDGAARGRRSAAVEVQPDGSVRGGRGAQRWESS